MVFNAGDEEEAERWAREESERRVLEEAEQATFIMKILKLEVPQLA